jgi:hypothetical protein
MRTSIRLLAAALTLCAMPAIAGERRSREPDAVIEWNSIMVATSAGQNPFAQARTAAITQLAVFEAVNAIAADYDPYLGTIEAPRHASREAAAIAAAHGVLRTFFPASAATLDAARDASLAELHQGKSRDQGVAVGTAAAAAMIALRAQDGSAPPEFHLPTSTAAGEWQMTPGCPAAGGILVHWRNLQPFAIETTAQFRSSPPPKLSSLRYAIHFNELRLVGDVDSPYRPQDRVDVARFYAAAPGVPVWNSAASQVAVARGDSLTENARAFALLNAAMSDALASVMETKYVYRFWRPETAIHSGDADRNIFTRGDANFVPLIVAPCFPGYGSAHASAAGAAREVLESLYGKRFHFVQLTHASLPDVTLQYHSFRQIAEDIDDARIFGGIHFRFDQEAGAKMGRDIGKFVYRNTLRGSQFRPRAQ